MKEEDKGDSIADNSDLQPATEVVLKFIRGLGAPSDHVSLFARLNIG